MPICPDYSPWGTCADRFTRKVCICKHYLVSCEFDRKRKHQKIVSAELYHLYLILILPETCFGKSNNYLASDVAKLLRSSGKLTVTCFGENVE